MTTPPSVVTNRAPLPVQPTAAPSICESRICTVKAELQPVLPTSTVAKLNETGSCQSLALEWIVNSDLKLERVAQRFALAVLSCELNVTGIEEIGANECYWLPAEGGVDSCNGTDVVHYLWLSGRQLSGTLPPELSMLPSLAIIDLSGNNIDGTIPTDLGNLPLLQELSLYGNDLTGSVPSQICSLSSKMLNTLLVDCLVTNPVTEQQTGVMCGCCTSCA